MKKPKDEMGLVELAVAVAGSALGVCNDQLKKMGIDPAIRQGTLYLSFLLVVQMLKEDWTDPELAEFDRVARSALPFLKLVRD